MIPRIRALSHVPALAALLAVPSAAFADEVFDFELAGAAGVTLQFSAAEVVADDGQQMTLRGDVTVGVSGIRNTLADAELDVTFAGDRVDTLVGSAELRPAALGALGAGLFGDALRGEVGLAYGDALDHLDAPIQPDVRYLFVDVQGGPAAALGPVSLSMGPAATLILDPTDPALFVRSTVDGIGPLTTVEEVAVGLSAHGRLALAAETTWGVEQIDTTIDGHLYIGGAVTVPSTPIGLDGELVLDADPDDDGHTLFDGAAEAGFLFNGSAAVDVGFGPFTAFTVPLGAASAGGQFVGDDADVWFSGETGLDLQDIVPELPLTLRNQRFAAGRLSTDLDASFVQFGATAHVAGWDIADALLRIDAGGARLAGEIDLHVGEATVAGRVDRDGFALTGAVGLDLAVKGPHEVTEVVETVVNYTANGAVCGFDTVTSGAMCGFQTVTSAAICGTHIITDGARCGWSVVEWFCGLFGLCSRRSALSCSVASSCDIEASCDVPSSCSRAELEERRIYVPDFEIGSLEGRLEVEVSEAGVSVDPDLELCLVDAACVPFAPASFSIGPDHFELCGDFPLIGRQCFDLCDVAGDLCNGARAAEMPADEAVYLGAADTDVSLRAAGDGQALDDCGRADADPSCQWAFVPAAAPEGAYTIRNLADERCLVPDGMNAAMGACGPDAAWTIEPAPGREGEVYVRAASTGLFLARMGAGADAELIMAQCVPDEAYAPCVWRVAFAPGAPPPVDADHFGATQFASPTFFDVTGGWVDNTHYPRRVGDVNGDGVDDVVGFGHGGIRVYTGTGGGSMQRAPSFDYDGGMYTYPVWGAEHPRFVADFDGDGLDDVIGFASHGVTVARSNGARFGGEVTVLQQCGYNQGWRVGQHVRDVADINGDGRADVVCINHDWIFIALNVDGTRLAALTPVGHGLTANNGGWRVDQHPRMLGDVDGDGRADLVGFGGAQVFVGLSNGAGFDFLAGQSLGFTQNNGGWRVGQHPRTLADVNGDGRDDIVGFGHAGPWVSLSIGDGTFAPATLWSDVGGLGTGWQAARHFRALGDLNGDGAADLLLSGEGAGLLVQLAASR